MVLDAYNRYYNNKLCIIKKKNLLNMYYLKGYYNLKKNDDDKNIDM